MRAKPELTCPVCGGADVRRSALRGAFEWLLALFEVAPIRCAYCKHRFLKFLGNSKQHLMSEKRSSIGFFHHLPLTPVITYQVESRPPEPQAEQPPSPPTPPSRTRLEPFKMARPRPAIPIDPMRFAPDLRDLKMTPERADALGVSPLPLPPPLLSVILPAAGETDAWLWTIEQRAEAQTAAALAAPLKRPPSPAVNWSKLIRPAAQEYALQA